MKLSYRKICKVVLIFIIFYFIFSLYVLTSIINNKSSIIPNKIPPIISPIIKEFYYLSQKGVYPGDKRLKIGKNEPIYTQRTSFLYYSRKEVGSAMIWNTLSMGIIGNSKDLVSDKKISLEEWKNSDPIKYNYLQKYLPKSWSNDDIKINLNQNSLYVFKPSNGADGKGLIFKKGMYMMNYIQSKKNDSWVIQEFINPYLFEGKKTHFRVLSLIVVRENGLKEFYVYNQMKMMTAPTKFNESLLLDENFINSDKVDNMLITNLRLSRELFYKNNSNNNKRFNQWDVVVDVEDSFGKVLYDEFFNDVLKVHSTIYDLIGDKFVCTPTEISIENSCFHIMASDIAFNEYKNPFFLEMNAAMGIKGIWKREEVREFSEGVSYIINNLNSPYKGIFTNKWVKI